MSIDNCHGLQAYVTKLLADMSFDGFPIDLIADRVKHWGADINLTLAADVLCRVSIVAGSPTFPATAAVSYIKTLCNGWATSARMGFPVAACRFGCGLAEGDRLKHYLVCPVARHAVVSYLPSFDAWFGDAHPLLSSLLLQRAYSDRVDLSQFVLVIDALLSAFNAIRHGSRSSVLSLFAARLLELASRRRSAAKSVARARARAPGSEPAASRPQ